MRSGPMKLLVVDGDTLLFNLTTDLGEAHNLASDSLELLQSMINSIHIWDDEMNINSQKTR